MAIHTASGASLIVGELECARTPPIGIPPEAARARERIVGLLERLVSGGMPSTMPLRSAVDRIHALYDTYYHAVLEGYPRASRCARGCCQCCNHWVEDLYSFESRCILEHLAARHAARVPRIRENARQDTLWMQRLDERLDAVVPDGVPGDVDRVDLLLHAFYRLGRPCPLLDGDGSCLIYPLRPLTCRGYTSFADPSQCRPDRITRAPAATALLDLDDPAAGLLDTLHFKHDRYEGDTSLRSVLAEYL